MTRPRVPEDEVSLVRQVADLKASVDAFRESTVGQAEYTRRHRRVVVGLVAIAVLLGLGAIDFWQQRETNRHTKLESVRADRVICEKQNEIKARMRDFVDFATIDHPRGEELRQRVRSNFVDTPCPTLIRERLAVEVR